MRRVTVKDSENMIALVHRKDGDKMIAAGLGSRKNTNGVWYILLQGSFNELPTVYRQLLR